MKFAITILLSIMIATNAYAHDRCNIKTVKIAVIDTGFGFNGRGHTAKLCKFGHKDFSIDHVNTSNYEVKTPVPLDIHGHGTNVVGIIDEYAKKSSVDYCIVVIKYYSDKQNGHQNLNAEINAIKYASNINADFINYSGGGPEFDEKERMAVEKFLNKGGRFIASAGNENNNIDIPDKAYYPASYDDPRIVVVGNNSIFGIKSKSSNYGEKVNRWEVGENITAFGITMSGTSQAAAVATGKIILQLNNKCDIGF